MTPEQILIALRNTSNKPRNIAPQVKVALDQRRTKPLSEQGQVILVNHNYGFDYVTKKTN